MSIRAEEILTCDNCNKSAVAKIEKYYAGHPFNGWFHVRFHGGSTALAELQRKREFDFCSCNCVLAYFKNES